MDKNECRVAFADMVLYLQRELGIMPWGIEYRINEQLNSPDYPTGCIAVEIPDGEEIIEWETGSTITIGKEISIRWNENTSGRPHVSAYQICKTGKK